MIKLYNDIQQSLTDWFISDQWIDEKKSTMYMYIKCPYKW